MTLFPIFFAEIENDLRRVLAYIPEQPAGLHGRGHWRRDRDGAERHCQPRLRAYPVQGAAVHERWGGDVPHRHLKGVGAWRPLPHHAENRDSSA